MNKENFLKNERKSTDDSLDAERDRANRSFKELKSDTEDQMDKYVTDTRLVADRAMKVARKKADAKNKDDSIVANKKDEERVTAERNRSDKAVELERSQADAALEKERELKRALAGRLFEQERKLTDRNLSNERTETDSEIHRNKVSLTTRDEFLAIVSHDLKNPIGAASSCAEMLLNDPTYSDVDPEVKHWIEFIKRNVDSSLRLIADLLDMERMALGKLELQLKECRIGALIEQSIENFTLQAMAKKILLKAKPIVGSDEVVCDQDRILQVFSNLIGNALKFTPEGGVITLGATSNDSEVQVCIKDTGTGIPEDKLGKIFERFAQLGSNDRRGLGLGLYISKMFIEAHGGKIWVQSKLNEGSTLFFTIPKASKQT